MFFERNWKGFLSQVHDPAILISLDMEPKKQNFGHTLRKYTNTDPPSRALTYSLMLAPAYTNVVWVLCWRQCVTEYFYSVGTFYFSLSDSMEESPCCKVKSSLARQGIFHLLENPEVH